MNKLFTLQRALTLTTASCCLLLLQTSCVNDEYDLSKVDSNINIGGNISLPLGSTDSIKLSSMLDVDDIENLEQSDGIYKISMIDSIVQEIELTDEPIVLDTISVNNPISSTFDKPSFPDIEFTVPNSDIKVDPGMSSVDLSGATPNSDIAPTDITFTKPNVSFNIADINIVAAGLSSITIDENKGESIVEDNDLTIDGIECTTDVTSVTSIEFGEGNLGSLITVTLDIAALNNSLTGLDAVLPSMKFEFNQEYTLSLYNNTGSLSGNNIVSFIDTHASEGKFSFNFYVEKLDKTLNNNSGTLDNIECDIKTTLSNEIKINAGTTNGTDVDANPTFELKIDAPLKVKDMDLVIADVSIPVEGKNELCEDPVEITGIPALIKEVTNVDLETGSKMRININALDLPLDANSSTKDITYLLFPTSKYVITTDNDIFIAGDHYYVTIPLDGIANGTPYTKDVYIEKIILENETLIVDTESADGDQYINFDPEISTTSSTLVLGGNMKTSEFNTFAGADPQTMTIEVVTGTWVVANSDVVINDYVAELDDVNEPIDIDSSIPDELTRIDSIEFQNKVYTTMNVQVEIDGLDSDLSFYNYTVQFPDFLQFVADDLLSGNTLNLSGEEFVKPNTGTNQTNYYVYSKQLEIAKLDFTDAKYANLIQGEEGEKMLVISGENITTSGKIKLAGGSEASTDELSETITGTVDVVVDAMTIGKTYGKVSPDLDIESTTIDLADLTESFDGSLSASLSNPSITLEIKNTLTVPLKIDSLILQPMKGGKVIKELYTTSAITVEQAPEGGQTDAKIVITAFDKTSTDEITYVKMENFKDILNDLPDSISINIVADVEGDSHMINLEISKYDLAINYTLDVPLEFDELSLDYTTSFDGLGESLSDITGYIDSLQLELDIANSIPLTLEIASITPLDSDGNELALDPMIVAGKTTIEASSESSLVAISIADKDNLLEKLEELEIRITCNATSTEGGVALSPDQFLKIKIRAKIPGGLTVNLEDISE